MNLPGRAALPDLRAALDALLARPDDLADWLGTRDTAEVAARSYRHPNGFAKLVLHADAGFRIRLHVWEPGEDRMGETNPHGHRWDFASTVLCGQGLRSTTYVEAPDGDRFTRFRYWGNSELVTLTDGCNVRLAEQQVDVVGRHDRYAVDTETIHTIDPLGTDLVATLVVQGPPRLASTPVYCPPGVVGEQPGRPILASEVSDLVKHLLAAPDAPWAAPKRERAWK